MKFLSMRAYDLFRKYKSISFVISTMHDRSPSWMNSTKDFLCLLFKFHPTWGNSLSFESLGIVAHHLLYFSKYKDIKNKKSNRLYFETAWKRIICTGVFQCKNNLVDLFLVIAAIGTAVTIGVWKNSLI